MKAGQTQSYDIPLHDIKPIVDVQEYSLYYFLGVSIFVLLLTCAIAYIVYLWFKRRNAFNIRKEHFKLLNSLDLTDTKQSAYAITIFGATFKDDSPRHQEMFANIINRLDMYKYKKEVKEFDSEVVGYIKLYEDMIDV
ncbi:MAG: hypothetical protein L3J19_01565 [Sulfurimonas sp.]|nr:hypothetical protein [Sulfurimonas sp.]